MPVLRNPPLKASIDTFLCISSPKDTSKFNRHCSGIQNPSPPPPPCHMSPPPPNPENLTWHPLPCKVWTNILNAGDYVRDLQNCHIVEICTPLLPCFLRKALIERRRSPPLSIISQRLYGTNYKATPFIEACRFNLLSNLPSPTCHRSRQKPLRWHHVFNSIPCYCIPDFTSPFTLRNPCPFTLRNPCLLLQLLEEHSSQL
jgi:hypothetical protein